MKKQLLIPFAKFLSQKKSFRMTAFAVLTFLIAQFSFAQTWVGTTNDFLLGTNWSASPTFATATLNIGPVVSPKFNPELLDGSAATTCTVLNVTSGGILTTSANLTTGTGTNTISGTLNV